jgi:hypothetical protein
VYLSLLQAAQRWFVADATMHLGLFKRLLELPQAQGIMTEQLLQLLLSYATPARSHAMPLLLR